MKGLDVAVIVGAVACLASSEFSTFPSAGVEALRAASGGRLSLGGEKPPVMADIQAASSSATRHKGDENSTMPVIDGNENSEKAESQDQQQPDNVPEALNGEDVGENPIAAVEVSPQEDEPDSTILPAIFDHPPDYKIPKPLTLRALYDTNHLKLQELNYLLNCTAPQFIMSSEAVYEIWLDSLKSYAQNLEAEGVLDTAA